LAVFRDHGTGKSFASDEVEGEVYPRLKMSVGLDGESQTVTQTERFPAEDNQLGEIIKQLKMMNMHLSLMTDCSIERGDIE